MRKKKKEERRTPGLLSEEKWEWNWQRWKETEEDYWAAESSKMTERKLDHTGNEKKYVLLWLVKVWKMMSPVFWGIWVKSWDKAGDTIKEGPQCFSQWLLTSFSARSIFLNLHFHIYKIGTSIIFASIQFEMRYFISNNQEPLIVQFCRIGRTVLNRDVSVFHWSWPYHFY